MAKGGEFGSMSHLAQRFFGALSPAGPPAHDEAWATGMLLPGELRLWSAMSGPDRRHAVEVARQVSGQSAEREVLAAALLHDVGKVEAGIGTFGRVAVTLAAMALGRRRLVELGRRRDKGTMHRVATYLSHDRVGGELLRRAGSDPFTVEWAEQHHMPPSRWSVDALLGQALKQADGD